MPPGSRPKNDRQRFDWAVSISIGVIAVIGAAHIAQACGFLTAIGLSGFAMASDVSQQQATLTAIQTNQLNRDMRDAKTQVCLASQHNNQAALDSWSRQLQASRSMYYAITKNWPDVQSCEELLVGNKTG